MNDSGHDDYIGLWQIDQTAFRYEFRASVLLCSIADFEREYGTRSWSVYQADYSRYLRPRLYSRAWWLELGRAMRTAVVDAWRAESEKQA